MALVNIQKGSNLPVLLNGFNIAPDFTQNDFHGKKADSRNSVPQIHTLDSRVIIAVQAAKDWSKVYFGPNGVAVFITSTLRTPEFQAILENEQGQQFGAHTEGKAIDWTFTGPNALEALRKWNSQIRDKGHAYQVLRTNSINSIGQYGPPYTRGIGFTHIDCRTGGKLSDPTYGRYSHWIEGNPPYEDDTNQPTEFGDYDSLTDITPNTQDQKVLVWTAPDFGEPVFVYDLIEDITFPGYGNTNNEILFFEDNGVTNHRRLYDALSPEQKREYGVGGSEAYSEAVDYPIVAGSSLYFTPEMINISKSSINTSQDDGSLRSTGENPVTYDSNITVQNIYKAEFYPGVLRKITLDPGYIPAERSRGIISKDIFPQCSVWVWSRTNYLQGEQIFSLLNVSPHIISVQTECDMRQGGSFSLDLAPVIGELTEYGWEVQNEEKINGQSITTGNINKEKLYRESGKIGSEFVRSKFYYEKILSQNDLVFIRFEKLKLDKEKEFVQLSADSFKGVWFDMIGLIDYTSISHQSNSTNVSIQVRGRDLQKVLAEDNSYFNPYSIGHASSLYGGKFGSNGRFLDGQFKDLVVITARSIRESLEFILHRISSIGYVPDDIFLNFLDRTQITIVKSIDGKKEIKDAKGIWQIMKLFIDPSVEYLRIIDDSVANPQGSILDLFNKVCQDPFVEFYSDTYGQHFYLMVRRPPFEKSTLLRLLTELKDTGDEVSLGGARDGDRTDAYLAYLEQLDKESSNEGDSFQAQEFSAKSSQFISQVTPVEAEKFKNMSTTEQKSRLGLISDQSVEVQDSLFPLIININEEDVYSDSLRFSQECYSWYEIQDRGNFAGASISLGVFPAVYFDEIAQIFGNRKLTVTSNYSNYKFFDKKQSTSEQNIWAEQASQHLAYLVESNIHLPFTRMGSITINGDRRIKKGTYIYYRPTNEVYYVEGVQNSFSVGGSVERTTTLNVSRGMVKEYIQGLSEEVELPTREIITTQVSYFNLVDIPRLQGAFFDIVTSGMATDKFDHKKDFMVNTGVFNFFLQKRQFRE